MKTNSLIKLSTGKKKVKESIFSYLIDSYELGFIIKLDHTIVLFDHSLRLCKRRDFTIILNFRKCLLVLFKF